MYCQLLVIKVSACWSCGPDHTIHREWALHSKVVGIFTITHAENKLSGRDQIGTWTLGESVF